MLKYLFNIKTLIVLAIIFLALYLFAGTVAFFSKLAFAFCVGFGIGYAIYNLIKGKKP